MPNCGVGGGGPEQYDDVRRLGGILGGAAVALWGGIRTHNQLGGAAIVQSVAVISTYTYEELPVSDAVVAVCSTRLTMPLAPYPSRPTADARLAAFKAERDAALARGAPAGILNVAERMYTWAKGVADGAATGEEAPLQEIEVWSLRLDGIAIAAVSAEALIGLGRIVALHDRSATLYRNR
jgi:hypothetical protein